MAITTTLTIVPRDENLNEVDVFVNNSDEIVLRNESAGFLTVISKGDWEDLKSIIEPILYDDGQEND